MKVTGTTSIEISHEDYEATLLPELGANLACLRRGDVDVLNTPASAEDMRSHPYSYGTPLLCPPNRILGAQFTYDGYTYRLPKNLPGGSHLHGLLHDIPWEAEQLSAGCVRARCDADTHKALADGFFPGLAFEVEYALDDDGLTQRFTVMNAGEHIFPFGLAFHTAFKVPFCPGSAAENVRLMMPLHSQCELSPATSCPTKEELPLEPFEEAIADESRGFPPMSRPIDRLYKRDMSRENRVTLYDTQCGRSVVYTAGERYLYWICWNDNANHGFVGLEPQTWISNAPYMHEDGDTDAELGILPVAPGESLTLQTNIRVE